jgi:hypothetical protein
MKLLSPLSRFMRVLDVNFTKIITRMSRTNQLSLIKLSLEIDYRSMTLSNHDISKLVRFVSKIKLGVVKYVLPLI